MASGGTVELVYEPHGAALELFTSTDREVLLVGPANTGKSYGIFQYLVYMAVAHPGIRVCVMRKTRVSLTTSGLVTLEEKVLSDGLDATYLTRPIAGGPGRAHRHSYEFKNGSVFELHGMDNPTRLFSAEYDLLYWQELTEGTEHEWESLWRAMRNKKILHPDGGIDPRTGEPRKFHRMIGDCNPDAEAHWLNKRFPEEHQGAVNGKRRLCARHEDNPAITDEDLENLRNLTGVRRARLYEGRWVSAEGQIWEAFDRDTHVVPYDCIQNDCGEWELIDRRTKIKVTTLKWFAGWVDWGFRNPGSMGVMGFDDKDNCYVVHEVYQTQKTIDWWADKAEKLRKKYDIFRFICDSARDDAIASLNERMGKRDGHYIAQGCKKVVKVNDKPTLAGLDAVRERFENDTLFILDNALESRDPELVADNKPIGLLEEIPSYVYAEIKDGQPVKEEPAKDLADHSCDGLRYLTYWKGDSDYADDRPQLKYPAGTYGAWLGHDEDDD